MSDRMSSDAGNFPVVDTKPMEPLSPATFALTDVPRSCSAFESASPSRVFVPSLRSAAVSAATP